MKTLLMTLVTALSLTACGGDPSDLGRIAKKGISLPPPPVITSPANGSTLGTFATFKWTGTADQYWLNVSTATAWIKQSGPLPSTTKELLVTGLPTTGEPIYVTLYFKPAGFPDFYPIPVSAEYTAASAPEPAAMISPADGSTLPGTFATFKWIGTAEQYWLNVATATSWIKQSGPLSSTTKELVVTGLPATGEPIYVMLYYKETGEPDFNPVPMSYTYTAASSPETAAMLSPVNGTTFSGTFATFKWVGTAEQYWLNVYTATSWIKQSGPLSSTTKQLLVTGLPATGEAIYVDLYYKMAGDPDFNPVPMSYAYTAASVAESAVMMSPVDGSTLSGTYVTFKWIGVAEQYWLNVATATSWIKQSGPLSSTTKQLFVTGLPATGEPIYVDLYYKMAGDPDFNPVPMSYTYTAASAPEPAAIISPIDGSTLPGTSATFQWVGVAEQYWLNVATATGWILQSGPLSSTTKELLVTGLPTTGEAIYVWLYYKETGQPDFNPIPMSYTYTAASPP